MQIRLLFKILPWAIVIVLLAFLYFRRLSNYSTPQKLTVENTTILQEIEAVGKLELVKYNFKEIIDVEQQAKRYFDFGFIYIPDGQDQKAALIASGEAVACIDLTKIQKQDVDFGKDSIYIRLPQPELCYYKLNMEKSSFYDLQLSKNKKEASEFVDEVYAKAEKQIQQAALESGILEDAEKMGLRLIVPLFESLTQTNVSITFRKKPADQLLSPAQ